MLKQAIAVMTCTIIISMTVAEEGLQFSGYEWIASEAPGGKSPGPNPFRNSTRLISVDSRGRLNLSIDRVDGAWSCAELRLTRPLGFGTYEIAVSGNPARLDPQAVFGFFTYDYGNPPHYSEVDIEFARWGDPKHPGGNCTVQPYDRTGNSHVFSLSDTPGITVCRLVWDETGVDCLVILRKDSKETVLAQWRNEIRIDSGQATLHLNFWLFLGKPPQSGRRQVITVDYFTFTSASGA